MLASGQGVVVKIGLTLGIPDCCYAVYEVEGDCTGSGLCGHNIDEGEGKQYTTSDFQLHELDERSRIT